MEVDNLEIRIESEARKALTNLDSLSDKLDKVSTSLSKVNSSGLNSFAGSVRNLSSAMASMNNVKVSDFNRLAKNIEKIANIDSGSINKASYSLQKMANAFSDLGKANTVSASVAQMASSISKLGYKTSSTAISNIPKLATSMNELITTLSKAPKVSSDVIQLTNALSNLASQGSRVKSATNAVSSSVKKASVSTDTYTASTKRAASSSGSLFSQVTRLTAAFFTLKSVVGTIWKSVNSSMDYGETINMFQVSLKKIGEDAAKSAGISMGSKAGEEYAISFMRSAEEFSKDYTGKLGLDPNMMMKYQAIFAQISNSMGTTANTADNLSRSFVMLGNDIASLWNIDTETAMKKLQSGIVGEIEPMRALGVDISNTALQQTAYNYGIQDSVSKMSQAAKVQLRYLTIMRQTSVAHTDLARTINSPSNQLRILKQQWDNLCRSIGNVFMPVVQAVLPYINALVIALRKVTDSIAAALGFETPDYADSDVYSDVSGGLDGVSDSYDNVGGSAGDATTAVEKFKKSIMGFDQFNIIQDNTKSASGSGSGGSSSGGSGGGGYGDLDDAINDATNGYMQKYNEQLKAMKDRAEELSDKIVPKIEAMIDAFDKMIPAIAGVAAAFTTYKLVSWFTSLGDKLSWIGTPAGVAALCVGALAALGTAIYKCWKDAKDNDLADRFGDISLSAEELEEAAKAIVDNGQLDALRETLSNWDELDDTKKKIDEAVTTIKKLNMKVSLGIKLDAGDEREYKEAIKSYIENCQTYAEQEHLAFAMSIELMIDDEDIKKNMLENGNKFYSSAEGELEKLGQDLNECVNAAWKDGLLDVDEAKEIQEIQASMANVMDTLATSKFEANIEQMKMNFDMTDLTSDSFKDLMKKGQELIQDAADDYDEVELNLIASWNAQVKAGTITTKEYDDYILELKKNKLERIGTITLNPTKIQLSSLIKLFKEELGSADKDITKAIENSLEVWEEELNKFDPGSGDYQDTWNDFFGSIESSVSTGYEQLSGVAKSNLKDLLKEMEPTKTELENIAAQHVALGESVPDSISKGLTATYMLEAMVGDTEAIAKLVGATMGDSEEYKKMLQTAIDSGEDVPESMKNAMHLKAPELGTSTEELIAAIETSITETIPSVEKTANTSGKAVGDEFASGMDSKQKKANKSGKDLAGEGKTGFKDALGIKGEGSSDFKLFANYCAGSFVDGLDAKETKVKKSGKGIGSSAKSGVKEELSISNSQSADFKTYGEQTMSGFVAGINAKFGDVSSAVKEAMKKAKEAGKTELDIHSPSKAFKKFGEYTIEGYNLGVNEGSEDTVSTMNQWANKVKSSADGLSFDPISIEGDYVISTSYVDGIQTTIKKKLSVISEDALTVGTAISQSLAAGIDKNLNMVESSIKSLVSIINDSYNTSFSVRNGYSSVFKENGNVLVDSFLSGFESKESDSYSKMESWATKILKIFTAKLKINSETSNAFFDFGEYITNGLASGINSTLNNVVNAMIKLSNTVTKTFTAKLSIHSPSRVFEGYGEYTVDGYNMGVENATSDTVSTMQKWGEAVKSSAEGLTVNPLTFQSSYKVNTQGLEGYQDLVSGNVSVGGKVENSTTSTIIIDGLEKAIESAVERVISKIPQKDIIMIADGSELARTVNKHKFIDNQRYQMASITT